MWGGRKCVSNETQEEEDRILGQGMGRVNNPIFYCAHILSSCDSSFLFVEHGYVSSEGERGRGSESFESCPIDNTKEGQWGWREGKS